MTGESAGPVVVVAGGAGGVGEKIVRDVIAVGGRAIVTSRADSRLSLLRAALPDAGDRLTLMRGESLLDVDLAEWNRVMHEMLTTHFLFARTFVPVLIRQGFGRYIGIGGGAALYPALPSANCS